MHVHLITDKYSVGGGLEHLYQIVCNMVEINFTIFANPGPGSKRFAGLKNVRALDHRLGKRDLLNELPAILHFHHFKPLLFYYLNPFIKKRSAVVFTAHGLHIHKYEFHKTWFSRLKYLTRLLMEKIILKKTDRIICVSREDLNFLTNKYGLNNVLYLTNGIDFSKLDGLSAKRKDLREKYNFRFDEFIFTTVARFNFQKGYDILIKAIDSYFKNTNSRQKVKFVMVGDGEEFTVIKQQIIGSDLASKILLMGERTDTYDIITASDCFILPSRWEGLPIVLIEAGYLKLPVLASDSYGNREIIQNNCGILFANEDSDDLAEKITEILQQKYPLNIYCQKLSLRVKDEYNLEKMVNGLTRVYRELLTDK